MKYEEYVRRISDLNEDLEEGMLFELQQKPPANLHERMIKPILKEKRRISFLKNYKLYASVMAAGLIFAVVINRPGIMEKINPGKNPEVNPKQYTAAVKDTANGTTTAQGSVSPLKDNTQITANPKVASETVSKNQTTGNEKGAADSTKATNQSGSKTAKTDGSTTKPNDTTAPKTNGNTTSTPPQVASSGDTKTTNEGSGSKQTSASGTAGIVPYKEPVVNYAIVLKADQTDIIDFINNTFDKKLGKQAIYKLTKEQFDNLDNLLSENNIDKEMLNEVKDLSYVIVKISVVD